jgi:hypothetical protein
MVCTRINIAQVLDLLLTPVRYCIDSLRNRNLQDADKKLFALLETQDSDVPVVLVSTRIDRFEIQTEGECKKAYMKKTGQKERALKSQNWDRIRELRDEQVEQFKEETRIKFHHTYPNLYGIVFTDAGMAYSDLHLSNSTH